MLHRLTRFFLDIIFPLECLGCQKPGLLFCPDCLRRLEFADDKEQNNLNISSLNKVFIAGDYDQPLLAKLIKNYKYNFLVNLGPVLARWLSLFWSGQNKPGSLLVIPIPLHAKRLRWRGFNQAEIIARCFSANENYPLSLNLKRIKPILPQAELNGAERLDNIRGAFKWMGTSLADKNVLLIDDVITTGATLNEAALILIEAGAKNIYGLVLAKG